MKVADYWAATRCGARGRGVCAAVVPVEVLPADGLFMKPPGRSHGEGFFSVVREAARVRWLDAASSVAELYDSCRRRAESTRILLVQPRVRPARSLLRGMSPHGLGTVCAVT